MEEQKQDTSNTPNTVIQADKADVEKNKVMAIVGYLIPILFFIPLLSDESKKSPFAKFHANQQLNLLLFGVIGYTASAVLMIILIGFLLYFVVAVAGLVFLVMGIINAANGTMKELPIIGKFNIIK
jgi:uncharacterized membrane protein